MAHSVHKKCDAKQPCTTCVNKNRSASCKYEKPGPNDDVPPKSQTLPQGDALPASSNPSEPGSSQSLSLDSDKRSSVTLEQFERGPLPLVLNKAVLVPSSGASVAEKILDVTQCLPRFTVLPSINFRAIPRPLWMPLSFVHPEHVQVSFAAGSDMDMSLYVFSLQFRKFSSHRRD